VPARVRDLEDKVMAHSRGANVERVRVPKEIRDEEEARRCLQGEGYQVVAIWFDSDAGQYIASVKSQGV